MGIVLVMVVCIHPLCNGGVYPLHLPLPSTPMHDVPCREGPVQFLPPVRQLLNHGAAEDADHAYRRGEQQARPRVATGKMWGNMSPAGGGSG